VHIGGAEFPLDRRQQDSQLLEFGETNLLPLSFSFALNAGNAVADEPLAGSSTPISLQDIGPMSDFSASQLKLFHSI
jgi:hypothetical protein